MKTGLNLIVVAMALFASGKALAWTCHGKSKLTGCTYNVSEGGLYFYVGRSDCPYRGDDFFATGYKMKLPQTGYQDGTTLIATNTPGVLMIQKPNFTGTLTYMPEGRGAFERQPVEITECER